MSVSVMCTSFMQAVEAAKTAAKSISDVQNAVEESESSKEHETEASVDEVEGEDENDKRRKEALDKLEKASEDSFLGQASHREVIKRVVCLSIVGIMLYFVAYIPYPSKFSINTDMCQFVIFSSNCLVWLCLHLNNLCRA